MVKQWQDMVLRVQDKAERIQRRRWRRNAWREQSEMTMSSKRRRGERWKTNEKGHIFDN